jgi:hypothetical protein
MWCCRRAENISWTEHVRNCVEVERNVLYIVSRRKGNWIGRIWRRIYFLEQVIEGKLEGKIDVTGRRERRRKQLLGDLEEKRG